MNDTQLDHAKKPVVMKGGLTHWVTEETWGRISETLANQKQHSFMRISELGGIVLNTAEIQGAYTIAQYDDIVRIKQGQWQCAYRKWHLKRGECECRAEQWRKTQDELKRIKEREENKPMTEEEKAASREAMTIGNEYAALRGSPLFSSMYAKHNPRGRTIRRSTVKKWEKETGLKADVTNLAIDPKA